MQFKKVLDNRFAAVVAGAAVVAMVGAGAGYAAGSIGSNDIIDNSVQGKDVKNGSLQKKDLTEKAINKLKGNQGPAGPQGPAGNGDQVVTAMTGDWEIRGSGTAALTPDGVAFGPYPNGGAVNNSVCTSAYAGMTFAEIESMSYNARYAADNDTSGVGVPYLRVFFDSLDGNNDQNRAIYSPNTQTPDADIDAGELNEWVATSGSWRWQDDSGDFPGAEDDYAAIQAAHAAEVVDVVCVSVGFTAGTNLEGLVRWMEINGTKHVFRG